MAIARIGWNKLPAEVRKAVEEAAGEVNWVDPVQAGLNSAVAVVLWTKFGRVFLKGLHEGSVTQQREAALSPHVRGVSPPLQWEVHAHGWHFLAFTHIEARHASYATGSPDLPRVAEVIDALGRLPCPDLPVSLVKLAEDRWAEYTEDPAFLAGDHLLHTDYQPDNVLIPAGNADAQLIDWAWPTRGAEFIDPACWVLQLMAAGHDAQSAQAWAERTQAWRTAPVQAVDRFALVLCRMWADIARQEPNVPWKERMAAVSREWLHHRRPR